MSNYARIHCLAEGETEQIFVEKILRPYLATKNIGIYCSLIGKRGGDIRFDRAKKDLKAFLLGDTGCYLTLMVDFYGTSKKDWPGLSDACLHATPHAKAQTVKQATDVAVTEIVSTDACRRFISYISMHEFEALLFSDPPALAEGLGVDIRKVNDILNGNSPEEINNSPQTAPSKRLEALMPNYKKTITGIAVAEKIGIDKMRQACPLFNQWLQQIEALSLATQ
jgi:hypothetical protein